MEDPNTVDDNLILIFNEFLKIISLIYTGLNV